MSKYVTDTEELRKAIALLGYVDGKLENLSKRITTVYNQLNEQQGKDVRNAQGAIYTQGEIYDGQMLNILAIKAYIELILVETLAAEEKAKTVMESEIKPETEDKKPGNNQAQGNAKPNTNTQINGVFKRYQNDASYNWKPDGYRVEDYSDFNVLKGFKHEYCICQWDYQAKYGFWGMCTAVADCMAGSIKKGQKIEPTLNDWDRVYGANWTYTDALPGTKKISVNEQCKIIYEQIHKGNPVVIRVARNADDLDGHSITAIGLRAGANQENVSPSDILVMDPGDGKIKTADQIYNNNRCDPNSIKLSMQDYINWSLIVPK